MQPALWGFLGDLHPRSILSDPTIIKTKMISGLRNTPIHVYRLRSRCLTRTPSVMNIELTNRCNLSCWFCPHQMLKEMKKKDIDWNLFLKYIDQVGELNNVERISPVGLGEPFLYPYWENALRRIKIKLPEISLRLTTNGTLVDDDIAKRLFNILGNDDHILFSLNAGDRETYRNSMGADKFDSVVDNINRFLQIRKSSERKPSVEVQIIVTDLTASSVNEFKAQWEGRLDRRKDVVFIRELENWGGKITTDRHTLKKITNRYPCVALWNTSVVDVDGNVYPCCEALSDREKSSLVLGNINETSLKELFVGKRFREIKEKHLRGKWDEFPECKKCDMWSSTQDIWFRTKTGFK